MRRATPLILLLLAMLLGALVAPASAADTPRRFVGYELAQARRAAFVAAARAPHAARAQVAAAAAPAAVQTAPAQVLSVQQISRQNVPPQPGSQPDTQAEPDIAVDPNDPNVVVAVFQQGRFEDAGSVDPGFAWSHDGGRSWRHGALPNLTTAVGGESPRASDPVVAFGPTTPPTPRPSGSTSRPATAR